MDLTFKLEDAGEAHARIDDPGHVGKIVLDNAVISLLNNCLEQAAAPI